MPHIIDSQYTAMSNDWHKIRFLFRFFFQAEDGIRDTSVTGVQTCALPIHMSLLTEEAYGFAYSQFARHVFGRTAVRSVAHHQQVSRDLFPHSRQNVYAIQHSFYRTKVRDVNEQLLAGGRKTPCPCFFGSGLVGFKVHEIVDHADFVSHAENLLRALANEFTDACNAVRLLDREF